MREKEEALKRQQIQTDSPNLVVKRDDNKSLDDNKNKLECKPKREPNTELSQCMGGKYGVGDPKSVIVHQDHHHHGIAGDVSATLQAMDTVTAAAFTVDSLMTNREQALSYSNSARLHSSGGMYSYCPSATPQHQYNNPDDGTPRYSPWYSPETSPESATNASGYRDIIFDSSVAPSCQLAGFRHTAVSPSSPNYRTSASMYYQQDCVGQKY